MSLLKKLTPKRKSRQSKEFRSESPSSVPTSPVRPTPAQSVEDTTVHTTGPTAYNANGTKLNTTTPLQTESTTPIVSTSATDDKLQKTQAAQTSPQDTTSDSFSKAAHKDLSANSSTAVDHLPNTSTVAPSVDIKQKQSVDIPEGNLPTTGPLQAHKFPLHSLITNAISPTNDPILVPLKEITSCLDLSLKESSFLEQIAARHPAATDLVGIYSDAKTPSHFTLIKQDLLQEFPKDWIGRFDLINATLTFSQLPASRWDAIFARILTLLKPGGWLQVVDLAGVHTYEQHVKQHAVGQMLIQGAMESLRSAPDSGLAQIMRLDEHLKTTKFQYVYQSTHNLKTGRLQKDPHLAQLSVETLAEAVLQAKNRGAFKDTGGLYSFQGHSMMFPDADSEWEQFEANIKGALDHGMQQQVVTVIAQKSTVQV